MYEAQRSLLRRAGITPALLAPVALLGLAVTAVSVTSAFLMAAVFSAVVRPEPAHLPEVAGLLAGVAVCALIRPALMLAREVSVNRVGTAFKTRLRRAVLDHLSAIGPAGMGPARIGRVQSALADGVENLEPYLGRYLPQVAVTVVTTVVLGAVLLVVDPVVGVVLIVCALAVVVLPRLWDRALAGRGHDHWEAYEVLNAEFVDSMAGMVVLKANNAAASRQRELDASSQRLLTSTMGQLRLSLVESGLTGFTQFAGPVVGAAVGIVRLADGAIDPADLFLILLVSMEMFRPFKDLSAHWHAGYLGTFAVESILAVLALPNPRTLASAEDAAAERTAGDVIAGEAIRQTAAEAGSPAVGPSRNRALASLDGASYTHPGTEAGIRGVSLQIAAGETVAIVGASGAGKSTLLDLLTGLVRPHSGTVDVAGYDPVVLDAGQRRRLLAAVSQHPAFFGDTVDEHLVFGLDPTAVPHADARDAALAAAALPGVRSRRIAERASDLSGGQRQRLAIARALIGEPQLLVLDEATSAMDARTEAEVLAGIRRTLPDAGVVMVSHRMASAARADRIVVVADGAVVEQGTHEELLAAGGAYASLWTAAASAGEESERV